MKRRSIWLAAICLGGLFFMVNPENVLADGNSEKQAVQVIDDTAFTSTPSQTAEEQIEAPDAADSMQETPALSNTNTATVVSAEDASNAGSSEPEKTDHADMEASSAAQNADTAQTNEAAIKVSDTDHKTDAANADISDINTSDTDLKAAAARNEDVTAASETAEHNTLSSDNTNPGDTAEDSPYKQTIQDGTYVIMSEVAGFKALDVSGASTADGANVQLYDANGTKAQKFNVKWNADTGSYAIVNTNSGKNLTAAASSKTSGVNLEQDSAGGTDSQRWHIVQKNGSYSIISVLNGMAVDIYAASSANGTNAWLFTPNGTPAQLFRFLTSSDSFVNFTDGVYTFATAVDPSKSLDIANGSMRSTGNLQIYQSNGTDAQKFILTSAGHDTWRVISLKSGMSMDLAGAGRQSGTNVRQYSNNDSLGQRWYIRNTGDGTCYFVPAAAADNALDVSGARAANGTNVQSYRKNGTAAQKFIASRVNYSSPASGEYVIVNAGSGRAVDVRNGSRKMKANVQLYDQNGTRAQKFIVHDLGNGFVTIENANSRHYLDVTGGSYYDRANVQQYRNNGTMAQRWIVHTNDDGTISFINAKSSKVLDIANGASGNGSNMQQYTYNGSAAQKFRLKQISYDVNNAPVDYSVEVYPAIQNAMDAKADGLSSSTGYLILVNCGNHLVNVYSGSKNNWIRLKSWACGDGAPDSPTIRGDFQIGIRFRSFGKGYTCWYATQFYGDYLFHSVVYDPDSQTKVQDGTLGKAVSHGCVRLALENARWIYYNIPQGTRVIVYD